MKAERILEHQQKIPETSRKFVFPMTAKFSILITREKRNYIQRILNSFVSVKECHSQKLCLQKDN